jgi:hypothetical protein
MLSGSSHITVLLAGIPTADDVNASEIMPPALSYIPESFHSRKSSGNNPLTVFIDLHLPYNFNSGPFKSQVKAANAGEQ